MGEEAAEGQDRTLIVMDMESLKNRAKGVITVLTELFVQNVTTQLNVPHLTLVLLEYAHMFRLKQVERDRRKYRATELKLDAEKGLTAVVYNSDTSGYDVFGYPSVAVAIEDATVVSELQSACNISKITVEKYLVEVVVSFLVSTKLDSLEKAYPMVAYAAAQIGPHLDKYTMDEKVEYIIEGNVNLLPSSDCIKFELLETQMSSRGRARSCRARTPRYTSGVVGGEEEEESDPGKVDNGSNKSKVVEEGSDTGSDTEFVYSGSNKSSSDSDDSNKGGRGRKAGGAGEAGRAIEGSIKRRNKKRKQTSKREKGNKRGKEAKGDGKTLSGTPLMDDIFGFDSPPLTVLT